MRVHLLTVLVGALPCGLSNLSGDVTKTKGPEKASYLLGRLVRTRLYANSSIPPRNDADFRLVEILREKDIPFHRVQKTQVK
jgi:hypothetical protein